MILNTGSRTDIPAFYSEWFMNRIREGLVMARNPYNPKLVISYTLDPKLIDVIVFCTKNPEPMLKHLDELKKLPNHHNDPFDRLIICQAIAENTTIITRDTIIPKYPVKTLW